MYKVGDRVILSRTVDAIASSIPAGTTVTIIDVETDLGRGYGFEAPDGTRVIECGWDCIQGYANESAKTGRFGKYKYVVFLPEDADVLRDEDDEVIYFDSIVEVEHCIYNRDDRASLPVWRSIGICKKCGSPLFTSTLDDYTSQCFTCDEDFFDCEQDTEIADPPIYFGNPEGNTWDVEQVESCPDCGFEENLYPNHIPEKDGYKAVCGHCGEEIMLCDACIHADDNPSGKCDWLEGKGCFRTNQRPVRVTFYANVTEDDIRALNKCFYDAMGEAMDIHDVWGLKIDKEMEEE